MARKHEDSKDHPDAAKTAADLKAKQAAESPKPGPEHKAIEGDPNLREPREARVASARQVNEQRRDERVPDELKPQAENAELEAARHEAISRRGPVSQAAPENARTERIADVLRETEPREDTGARGYTVETVVRADGTELFRRTETVTTADFEGLKTRLERSLQEARPAE